MARFIRFLSYHNAVPLAIGIIVLGGTGAFAATNPEAILSTSQQVVSTDNTYIANKDLSAYTSRAEIVGVTEDSENYYVAYRFYTIEVTNAVWQDVVEQQSMTVSKDQLNGRDLGLYVTEQLKQLIGHANEYLSEAQQQARRNVSQKVVATEYGGLVGAFLDEKTEVLPGYVPVVRPQTSAEVASAAATIDGSNSAANPQSQIQSNPPGPGPQSNIAENANGIQIMGDNPAKIALKTPYSDLGVYVSDPLFQQFGVHVTLDGAAVDAIQIDTSKVGTHTITYTVSNGQGASLTATRVVDVYDPYANIVVTPLASTTGATTTGAQ